MKKFIRECGIISRLGPWFQAWLKGSVIWFQSMSLKGINFDGIVKCQVLYWTAFFCVIFARKGLTKKRGEVIKRLLPH